MYAAKRSGGAGYCFFEPSMEADAHDQLDLQRDLRLALENNELELFYQPKVDAHSGKVTAAEALLRWKHPKRGMISPATFIPMAERFGLIGALGNWVIEDACRQVARLARQGPAHARRDQPVGLPDAPGRPRRAHRRRRWRGTASIRRC